MSNIQFPSNITDFQQALKIAIEQYQGSPVKNQNKLNEVTAQSLGLANYDTLASMLNKVTTDEEHQAFPIGVFYSNSDNEYVIEGETISQDAEEEIDYSFTDREDHISNLIMWISEAERDHSRSHDAILMKKDLQALMSLEDEIILSSLSTNDYVSPSENIEEWNELCENLLEAQKAINYQTEKRISD